MITVFVKICNKISQDIYNKIIKHLPIHRITCPCGKTGCLIRYGSYHRKVYFLSEKTDLSVQRVFCKECGHTHALLFSPLVPYSRIPRADQQEIICLVETSRPVGGLMNRNYLIDENHVKYIIRQYRRHWKQRLLAIGASLNIDLTVPCLSNYSRQFMQIHRTPNILFSPPT